MRAVALCRPFRRHNESEIEFDSQHVRDRFADGSDHDFDDPKIDRELRYLVKHLLVLRCNRLHTSTFIF